MINLLGFTILSRDEAALVDFVLGSAGEVIAHQRATLKSAGRFAECMNEALAVAIDALGANSLDADLDRISEIVLEAYQQELGDE